MKARKKILYIVEAMGGGVFTYIVDLANELIKEYDIYIAYSTRSQTPINYLEYFDKRIKLIKVNSFTRELNFIKDIKAFSEIKKIESKIKPDIIHLHSSKAGAIGRIAFSGKKVDLFYTPHGYSFLMKNCSRKKRFIFKTIEKICAMRSCITIACSKGEYLEAMKLNSKALYVNNGININNLNESISKLELEKKHKFTVSTLGRICKQKNPELFNEIALKLPSIDFVWVGDGELRDELTAPNIKIVGWVERKKALEFVYKSDIFILTSLWEGLPISLLEAMYMKKVCLVSNVIGNRDVIKSNINGFVCNDVNDFVDIISKIELGNKNVNKNSIAERAYKEILSEYNTKVMASRYSEIYLKKKMNGEIEDGESFYNNGSLQL